MKIENENICPCGKKTIKGDGYCDEFCYEKYEAENFTYLHRVTMPSIEEKAVNSSLHLFDGYKLHAPSSRHLSK